MTALPATNGNGNGGRDAPLILIVEDDAETRHFYINTLRLQGFRTDDAHNGLQALEKAFSSTPDLVLADIAVPGIDGIELCRRLRATPGREKFRCSPSQATKIEVIRIVPSTPARIASSSSRARLTHSSATSGILFLRRARS
jgi:CheY-like chemotaxis protein